ncbi:MAG: hypothetical protein ACR2PK_16380 [Acidimicrobiales bacterium]
MAEGSTSDVIELVLADRPDVFEHLSSAHAAAAEVVDPRLLGLCTARVAMLLGLDPEASPALDADTLDALSTWPDNPEFSETERACLAFTEQFVVDVANIPDELAEPVVEAVGPDGFANFVTALLVNEQRIRLRLIWDRVLDGDPT